MPNLPKTFIPAVFSVLAALAAAAPAAPAAADEAAGPTDLFNALWLKKNVFSAIAGYRLMVVEIVEPKEPPTSGPVTLKLRAVADLQESKDFKPEEFSMGIYLNDEKMKLSDRPGKQYVGILNKRNLGNNVQWTGMPLLQQPVRQAGAVTYTHTYFVAVDKPNALLLDLCRELILDDPAAKPGDRFKKMLEYVASDSALARDLASSLAAVNGWEFDGSAKQADDFARTLLDLGDDATRRRMAGAYATAEGDLLPRDDKLLARLFALPDAKTLDPALGQGLKHAAVRVDKPDGKSAEVLTGLIRAALSKPVASRGPILRGLTGWSAKALAFRGDLERIALGDKAAAAETGERLTALAILLDAPVDNARELVLATVAELPSAVALDYAFRNHVNEAAPAVIQAVRAAKLQWTDAHSAAMSLLTGRFPGGRFPAFDQWWAEVEKSGQVKQFVADGFADPQLIAQAEKLVVQLGSNSYRERQQARESLVALGMPARKALEAALISRDPAVAGAAETVLAKVQEVFKGCETVLAAAVAAERNGEQPLVSGAPSPDPANKKEGKP